MPIHFIIPRRALFASVLVVLLLVVGLTLYTRLPRAVITVYPATHQRTVSQDITLSSGAHEPDFVRFILPARVVEANLTESHPFARSGNATTEDFSRGTVTLFNKQDEEQRLLPKTHLRHEEEGVFFLTDTAVAIPPQGETQVSVTAKEKGPASDVVPGKFIVDKLPASVQTVVFGESTTPTSGGLATESPLTGDELAAAKETVQAKARARVRAELSSAAGGAGIRDDLMTVTVEEETVSAQPGSRAAEFSVSVKIAARAFVVDENDVLSLTLLALRSSPAADEEFVSYSPESFTLEIIRSDPERGEARVKGTLTGSFASKTGPTVLAADNLAGRSESEVKEYFAQFPAVGSVTVEFSPFWVTAVPARKDATEITITSQPQ